MRWLVLALVGMITLIGSFAILGFATEMIARRLGKKTDLEGEGCSCTAGVIAIVGLAITFLVTTRTHTYLWRHEHALEEAYIPLIREIQTPLRNALFDPNIGQHTGRGILVVDAARDGSFRANGEKVLELPEPCRASTQGTPRFVIAVQPHSVVVGHRVGAGARTLYDNWYNVHLVDFVEGRTEMLKSEIFNPDPEDFPDKEYEELLERAISAERCAPTNK